jgi:hypothetical protein
VNNRVAVSDGKLEYAEYSSAYHVDRLLGQLQGYYI